MNFKIHRGTKEIGGSCVEVWTDTTRIVIDMGMPLVNPDRTPFDAREAEKSSTEELIQAGILPDIPSLYEDSSNTALLISHAHQDHYGFINHISPSCRVWLGIATKLLIEITNTFLDRGWGIQNANHLKNGKKFKIGDIEITPYLMDHSAFDSYAFLIEADGKSLLYSGDFRLHGRSSKQFDWFCSDIRKNVDYLLLEGSTIGRTDEPFPSEKELEDEFIKVFKKTGGINMVFVSGQNIDRLKTIYQACCRCNKSFLIDFYTAYVLKTLNKKADNTVPFPSRIAYPNISVYYPSRLTTRMVEVVQKPETVFPFNYYKISKNDLDKMADKLVMLVRPTVQSDLERFFHHYDNASFVYSMWSGYKNQPGRTKDFLDFIESKGVSVKYIHTSGHADIAGLKRMVDAVKPRNIVPIHTFEAGRYAELFQGTDVVMVNDREVIKI